MKLGVYGPKHFCKFYCRECWFKYFRSTNKEKLKEWAEWTPQFPKVTCRCRHHHELKSVLLALARVGGSIIFPISLSEFTRLEIQVFCEGEPELSSMQVETCGEGSSRFLRVTTMGIDRCSEEAVVCSMKSSAARWLQKGEEDKRFFLEAIVQRDRLQEKLDQAMGLNLNDLPLQDLLDLQRAAVQAGQRITDEVVKRCIRHRKHAGVWQWQTPDGTFEDFEAEVIIKIEAHLARFPEGGAQPVEVTNNGCCVQLDFNSMTQEVVGGSGNRRHIRCADDLLLQEPSWTPQTDDFVIVTVNQAHQIMPK